jgi:hypothetical protein
MVVPVLYVRATPSGPNTVHENDGVPPGAGLSVADHVSDCPWAGLDGGVTVSPAAGAATWITTGVDVLNPFWSVAVRVTTSVPDDDGVSVYVGPFAVVGETVPAVANEPHDRVYVFVEPDPGWFGSASVADPVRVSGAPGAVESGAPVIVRRGTAREALTTTGALTPVRFWSSFTVRATR